MESPFFTRAAVFSIACALAPAFGRADDEPVKLAAMARFDISADADTGVLNDGQVVAGNGTIARMTWVPEAEQARIHGFLPGHAHWLAFDRGPVHSDPERRRDGDAHGSV